MTSSYERRTKIALTLIAAYIVSILISICTSLSDLYMITHLDSLRATLDSFAFEQLLQQHDYRSMMAARFETALWFVSCISVLVWVYTSNKNLQNAAKPMTISPGWSVGWYFIPFANWWKPYEAMREIVQHSQNASGYQQMAGKRLIGIWWLSFVLNGFLGYAAGISILNAKNPETFAFATKIGLFSAMLSLFASILIGKVILFVSTLQKQNPDLQIMQNVKKAA